MKGTFFVRIAISFVFVVFGIWEILNPVYWAPFIPEFVAAILNPLFATRVHGLVILVLGVLTFIGFRKNIVAPLTSLTLASIVLSVFFFSGFTDLLVRDIVIFLCSLTLISDIMPPKEKTL